MMDFESGIRDGPDAYVHWMTRLRGFIAAHRQLDVQSWQRRQLLPAGDAIDSIRSKPTEV